MKNPWRAYGDWRRQEAARVAALGGWRLFWFNMTIGLVWGLVMFASTVLLDYYRDGAPQFDRERVQLNALIYFVGGLLFGLAMWTLQPGRRGGGR